MLVHSKDLKFDPPLELVGGRIIHSLDEATAFVRSYEGASNPLRRDGVLHRMEAAQSEQEMRDAALAFRAWVEGERLLVAV
jgi:hypothetical protein